MEIALTASSASAWRQARGGPASTRIELADLSRVGEARRAAETIARSTGLDDDARGRLGIIVTEAATNLARHARDGVVLLRETSSTTGVEMLAVHHGPGMEELGRFFADGYSTGGTSGTGLGAIRRQADELDVYSTPGQGTVVMARVIDRRAVPPRLLVDVGVVCLPLEGQTACGDGWCILQDDGRAAVLLVDGLGHGPLAPEQDKQIAMVQRSAETLTEMVSDLLDIAKIEAGKVTLRPDRFDVSDLFASLRGMFRPLATSDQVALEFEEPAESIVLHTDEQRIAQILRNLVSNALKFTTRGDVRVSARCTGDDIRFTVADTGIGIAPLDQKRIFEEYEQVEGPIQRRVRGTGLGLPLTRKLAMLLGGRVTLESEPGVGSRFSVIVPRDVRAGGAGDVDG